MGLESTTVWPEIVQRLNAMSMKDLAVHFGVTPGAISSAMIRTGCRRRPVRNPADHTSRWMGKQGTNDSGLDMLFA